jgi:hypothetical protein
VLPFMELTGGNCHKIDLAIIVGQAHNAIHRATPARPHGQAAVWVAANSVGSLLHADAHPPG